MLYTADLIKRKTICLLLDLVCMLTQMPHTHHRMRSCTDQRGRTVVINKAKRADCSKGPMWQRPPHEHCAGPAERDFTRPECLRFRSLHKCRLRRHAHAQLREIAVIAQLQTPSWRMTASFECCRMRDGSPQTTSRSRARDIPT